MTYASALKRNAVLEQLKGKTFDVLIVGGGITGVGIALDAESWIEGCVNRNARYCKWYV